MAADKVMPLIVRKLARDGVRVTEQAYFQACCKIGEPLLNWQKQRTIRL